MSTDRQIEANRSNARKSTGPRTAEGKARVAENALKHGLVGRHIVLPNENPRRYNAFRAGIFAALQPEGDLESLLADTIVADAWRLRRIPMLEAAVHRRSHYERPVRQAQEVLDEVRAVEKSAILASFSKIPKPAEYRVEAEKILREVKEENDELFMLDPVLDASRVLESSVAVFANLWRHERALSAGLHRALHELQRLQAIRRGEIVPAPGVLDLELHADAASTTVALDSDRS